MYEQDILGIWNMALSHLASGIEVQDVDESSKEAQACRRFYDPSRRQALRAFPWPWATSIVSLSLVAGAPLTPATTEWIYSYRIPSDCLRFVRILSGCPQDTQETRIPYRLIRDTGGMLILTNYPVVPAIVLPAIPVTPALPQGEYILDMQEPGFFPPDFADALSWLMAWKMAPRISRNGDQLKFGERARIAYLSAIEQASDMAMNEEQPYPTPEASWIRERE